MSDSIGANSALNDLPADVQALLQQAEQLVQQAKANPLPTDATIGQKVAKWFELKEQSDKLKDAKKQITDIQDVIEGEIIAKMQEDEMDRVSTKDGTFTLKPKSMPSVTDIVELVKWINEDIDNRVGFLQKQVNAAAVNEYLENEGQLPPGVKTYMKDQLTRRAARK